MWLEKTSEKAIKTLKKDSTMIWISRATIIIFIFGMLCFHISLYSSP